MSAALKAFDTVQADTYFYVPFGKTVMHDDGTMTVAGKASSESVDSDGQIVDRDLIKRLLPKWAAWGAVREMHQPKAIGTREDHYFDEDGDPVVVARVVDADAVRKVRHGVLKGFSVGLHRPKTRYDSKAPKGRIVDAEDMPEISLVDRPANPDCRFSVLKMLSPGEWLDCQKGVAFRESDVPDGIARDERDTADRARQGDIQDPYAGNSGDVGADQAPLLQPALLRDSSASVRVVSLDDRAAIVRMDGLDWVCPYTVDGDGVHVDMEAARPLPQQMRAEAPPPQAAGHEMPPLSSAVVRDTEIGKGAEAVGASVVREEPSEEAVQKAVWSTAYVDSLPDSAFAYVEPGADKDKSKRHLPYRDKDGKIDAAHVRNALARLDQTHIGDEAKAEARRKLEAAAKEVGVEVGEPATKGATIHDFQEAATKAARETVHCAECGKRVKIGDRVEEKAMAGGKFARYKGACGHVVGRFEPAEKAAEPDGDKGGKPEDGGKGAAAAKSAGPEDAPKAADGGKGTAAQEEAVSAQIERLEADLKRLREKQAEDEGRKADDGRKRAEAKDEHSDGPPQDGEEDADLAAKMARVLGMTPREIARTARQRQRAGLVAALEGLLEQAKAIPDEPAANKAAQLSPARAPASNDTGPAPAESGHWAQRIREGVGEVDELVRMLERSEKGLVHGDSAPPSRLSREIGSSPRSKPAGPTMDQRLDDLPTPEGRQDFTGKTFTPEQVQEIAAKAAAAATSAVTAELVATQKRLGVVEKMARPASPAVAVPPGYQEASQVAPFASPEQFTRSLGIDPRTLQGMPEAQRERMVTQLLGQRLGTTSR